MPPLSDSDQKQLWDWNFTNHTPTPAALRKIEGLRAAAKAMKDAIIDMVPAGRDRSLSLTALEQTLFSANAGIARVENTDGEAEPPAEDVALAAAKANAAKAQEQKKPDKPGPTQQNDKPKQES